ncbi:hypothetical protein Tsac_2831 [Thermoanaerobacterium phage THSA-485A]|uniref:hypothetical protein n=1 Tax=Thermoanaerobacterium phage THSA-485A TaxID=1126885 RepID=UPI000263F828|nr:hypothetical protein Tsac_2831 [Thermoanaerobacterium phage THSA-485A]AFK87684.1 hypothetical protein Tsac_2831 [Thermoanaerobacterium phage THSA-485A]
MKFDLSSPVGIAQLKDLLIWGSYKYPTYSFGDWIAYNGYDMSGHFDIIGFYKAPFFDVDSCGTDALICMWYKSPHTGLWHAKKKPKFLQTCHIQTCHISDKERDWLCVVTSLDIITFLRQNYGIW